MANERSVRFTYCDVEVDANIYSDRYETYVEIERMYLSSDKGEIDLPDILREFMHDKHIDDIRRQAEEESDD